MQVPNWNESGEYTKSIICNSASLPDHKFWNFRIILNIKKLRKQFGLTLYLNLSFHLHRREASVEKSKKSVEPCLCAWVWAIVWMRPVPDESSRTRKNLGTQFLCPNLGVLTSLSFECWSLEKASAGRRHPLDLNLETIHEELIQKSHLLNIVVASYFYMTEFQRMKRWNSQTHE